MLAANPDFRGQRSERDADRSTPHPMARLQFREDPRRLVRTDERYRHCSFPLPQTPSRSQQAKSNHQRMDARAGGLPRQKARC